MKIEEIRNITKQYRDNLVQTVIQKVEEKIITHAKNGLGSCCIDRDYLISNGQWCLVKNYFIEKGFTVESKSDELFGKWCEWSQWSRVMKISWLENDKNDKNEISEPLKPSFFDRLLFK